MHRLTLTKVGALTQFSHGTRALINAFGYDGALTQIAAMAVAVMEEYKKVEGGEVKPKIGRRKRK